MRLFVLTFAFAALASAQAFHIIRVIPSGATPGSVLFCGDNSHATTCVTEQATAAGTKLTLTGNETITGTVDIGGVTSININSASDDLTIVNTGLGRGINLATQGANASVTIVNSNGSGNGVSSTVANSGAAIIGITSGIGFGGFFQALSGGTAVFASNNSAAFPALSVSNAGAGLAAHFTSGNVTIDNNLLISGACTGCGVDSISSTGNGLSFSASTGTVSAALAQDIRTTANTTFALGTFTNGISVGGAGSSFNINSSSDVVTIVNSGSGRGINMTTAGTGASIILSNSNGSGNGLSATVANSGAAVIGVTSGVGIGGFFTALSGGTAVLASNNAASFPALSASNAGAGLAAHFISGDVTIDANLNATGGIIFGAASNSYLRTFSGAPSCVAVTDGWFGFDTSVGILYICNGGVATVH